MPEYEIKRWDETNTPIKHPFIKAALKEKYFAFVADFVRFFALQEHGGIYLDTDMLALRNFDDLLKYDLFLGEEAPNVVNFAALGAKPQHPLVKKCVEFYDEKKFNSADLPIISFALAGVLNEFKQGVESENYKIFDARYFYPLPFEKKAEDYKSYITQETFAVHLWNHSWRNSTDYIRERNYKKAFEKIITEILHNKSARFNIRYYNNLYWHFKGSFKKR